MPIRLFELCVECFPETANRLNALGLKNVGNLQVFDAIRTKSILPFQALSKLCQEYFKVKTIVLSDYFAFQKKDLNTMPPSLQRLLKYHYVHRLKIIPFQFTGEVLSIAMVNPFQTEVKDDIAFVSNLDVRYYLAEEREVSLYTDKLYTQSEIHSLTEQAYKNTQSMDIQNAPVVKLVNSIISSAVYNNASDIHIEPTETEVQVRYRIDGVLLKFHTLSKDLLPNIISRLKILGKMDIAGKLLPQDGHFTVPYKNGMLGDLSGAVTVDTEEDKGSSIDFRLSTFPTVRGEKAVVRLIYNFEGVLNKHELGFLPEDIQPISELFHTKYGAVLITGPTGSGKTTTLTGFIQELDKEQINIVTVEDPIEKLMDGVNQSSVNPKINLDFPNVLKFILRQDPDVIMIGEIRDSETAELSIRAAITGHLVLSTLHTNDAISAIARLIDMGIESYLCAAALKGIISQRLVRRICNNCKKRVSMDEPQRLLFNMKELLFHYKGEGCNLCNNTGYKGRFAIYEYIVIDTPLREMIQAKASYDTIQNYLLGKGMVSLWENGVKNILLGNTTPEEVYKALYSQ